MWVKVCGSSIILLASLKYQVYQWIGGAFFSPDLPRIFILGYEVLYSSLIILFFLLIMLDIYLALNWVLARGGMPVPSRIPVGAIKICLLILALGTGCLGVREAIRVPDTRVVEAYIRNLPPQLDGVKIAQLTDLHVGPLLKKDWLQEVVDKANALEPDVYVLTGDYIDGTVEEILEEVKPLSGLKARYGVFGVTGNHEYYWNAKQWLEALKNLNIKMLNNERVRLEINGSGLNVVGLPDERAGRFGHAPPDIRKAVEGITNEFVLLLAHSPKNSREYLNYADLQLSGHAHGGLMFFLRPLVAAFNNGFVVGEYDVNGKKLYVSPGTGLWNGFSSRVGNPSEITLIILRSGK